MKLKDFLPKKKAKKLVQIYIEADLYESALKKMKQDQIKWSELGAAMLRAYLKE